MDVGFSRYACSAATPTAGCGAVAAFTTLASISTLISASDLPSSRRIAMLC